MALGEALYSAIPIFKKKKKTLWLFMIILNIFKQLNLPLGHTITHIFADEVMLLNFEEIYGCLSLTPFFFTMN